MIDGKTQLIGLLGSPVAHSLSPAIHNTAFDLMGLNYRYLNFDVDESHLKTAVDGLKTLGARGWNLTMPDKTAMAALCDELSPAAKIIGAVNTVVNDDGRLIGHITDGAGFTAMLTDAGVVFQSQKVIICGAGGAARAVAIQLALDGAKTVVIFNRTLAKAQKLADTINVQTGGNAEAYALSDEKAFKEQLAEATLLINGTKLGMAPDTDSCVMTDASLLRPELTVADFVYHPLETKLLKTAKARGCRTLDGIGMLIWQGALAFKFWTGKDMPVADVRKRVFA